MKIGKKTGLFYFGLKEIRSWNPCYDPIKHLPEDWRGTAVDILKNESIPHRDRIWCVVRVNSELLSTLSKQLFAIWSARQVNHLMKDPRSVAALDAAELFLRGEITKEEIAAAYSDAYSAAYSADAAYYSADSAAYYAADSAAAASAYATYADAVAAYSDAYSAAYSAASAYYAAYYAADSAAAAYARETSHKKQIEKLIEMLLAEGFERLKKRKQDT